MAGKPMNKPVPHGTTTGYAHYKCRCDACRAAVALYGRRRQAEKRAGVWRPTRKQKLEPIPCSFVDCDRVAKYHAAPTLCGGHLQQHQKGQPLRALVPKNKIMDGHKACSQCGQVLPVAAYDKQYGRPVGKCKVCLSIYTRARRYGVTFDEMQSMVRLPCAGCGATGLSGKNLHIDHCHGSGTVRGVLCRSCNLILTEHVTSETLRRLAAYLDSAS